MDAIATERMCTWRGRSRSRRWVERRRIKGFWKGQMSSLVAIACVVSRRDSRCRHVADALPAVRGGGGRATATHGSRAHRVRPSVDAHVHTVRQPTCRLVRMASTCARRDHRPSLMWQVPHRLHTWRRDRPPREARHPVRYSRVGYASSRPAAALPPLLRAPRGGGGRAGPAKAPAERRDALSACRGGARRWRRQQTPTDRSSRRTCGGRFPDRTRRPGPGKWQVRG